MSNTDMRIASNKDINKHHKKLPLTPPDDDMPKIVFPADRHDNLKMLIEKHNVEKLQSVTKYLRLTLVFM